MKIAVACDGRTVTEHFGHCENFIIYDVVGKEIIKETIIPNPGHRPGFLPNFLNEQCVKVIISGGMGGGAVDIFDELDIEVVIGANGSAREAAEGYLNGSLISSNSVCHSHDHS